MEKQEPYNSEMLGSQRGLKYGAIVIADPILDSSFNNTASAPSSDIWKAKSDPYIKELSKFPDDLGRAKIID